MAETANEAHAVKLPGFFFKAPDHQHVKVQPLGSEKFTTKQDIQTVPNSLGSSALSDNDRPRVRSVSPIVTPEPVENVPFREEKHSAVQNPDALDTSASVSETKEEIFLPNVSISKTSSVQTPADAQVNQLACESNDAEAFIHQAIHIIPVTAP